MEATEFDRACEVLVALPATLQGKDHLTVIPDILAEGLRAVWPEPEAIT